MGVAMSSTALFWLGWLMVAVVALLVGVIELVRDHLAWRRAFPQPPRAYVRRLRRNRADLRRALRRAS